MAPRTPGMHLADVRLSNARRRRSVPLAGQALVAALLFAASAQAIGAAIANQVDGELMVTAAQLSHPSASKRLARFLVLAAQDTPYLRRPRVFGPSCEWQILARCLLCSC